MATGWVDVNASPNLDSRCTEPPSQPADATENINGANSGEIPLLGHVLPRFWGLRVHSHHSQHRVFVPVRFVSNISRGLFIGASLRVHSTVTGSPRLCPLVIHRPPSQHRSLTSSLEINGSGCGKASLGAAASPRALLTAEQIMAIHQSARLPAGRRRSGDSVWAGRAGRAGRRGAVAPAVPGGGTLVVVPGRRDAAAVPGGGGKGILS